MIIFTPSVILLAYYGQDLCILSNYYGVDNCDASIHDFLAGGDSNSESQLSAGKQLKW